MSKNVTNMQHILVPVVLSSVKTTFLRTKLTIFGHTTKIYFEDSAVSAKICRRVLIIIINNLLNSAFCWCVVETVIIRYYTERKALK